MSTNDVPVSKSSDSICVLISVVGGTILGFLFGAVDFGVSMGLMIGCVATMVLARRRRKESYSILVIVVSVVAITFVAAMRVIDVK